MYLCVLQVILQTTKTREDWDVFRLNILAYSTDIDA